MPSAPALLPPEVKAAVTDGPAEGLVWAVVGSSPGSSLGETYLVAANGRLVALTRGSHFDPFVRLALRPAEPPALRAEGFATWLELGLADGTPARLALTPFDLDGAKRVMAALGADTSALPVVVGAAARAPEAGPVPTQDALDAGLALLAQAGARAAQRSDLDFLRVRTRVAGPGGWIELETEYDARDLARLRG